MSQAIWKYPIQTTGRQVIGMPTGAEILTVQTQREKPCLWALVNTDAPIQLRAIETVGTGHLLIERIGTQRRYIGTYQLHSGTLVFHVFEVITE